MTRLPPTAGTSVGSMERSSSMLFTPMAEMPDTALVSTMEFSLVYWRAHLLSSEVSMPWAYSSASEPRPMYL